VNSVQTTVNFGKPVRFVTVLCPSKLNYDGLSVQTSHLVGLREKDMPYHSGKKKKKKKGGMKRGKKKSARGGLKPCLTAAQKKLPAALKAGIRKRNRPCK